jgi:hypothetical protein
MGEVTPFHTGNREAERRTRWVLALVAHWSYGLIRQTSVALLDREMGHPVGGQLRQVLTALPASP